MVALDIAIVNVALPVIQVDLGMGQSALQWIEGQERNWALGIFGAIGGTSASVGVLASGLLTDGPGWPWIFFINVPIGAALTLLAARTLPADRPPVGSRRFDAVGASTVTVGLLLFVYALNRGVDHGWTSTTTFALFGGAVALLATFAVVESRSRSALVPVSVLRNRTLVAADLMPAFLLAGVAIGVSAPSVQIGALSGVRGAAAGLASGLVETMREIGGAVGIAIVTTVLVTRTRDAVEVPGQNAGEAALEGFQSAFIVIVALAALGAVVASIAFPRSERLARMRPEDETQKPLSWAEPAPAASRRLRAMTQVRLRHAHPQAAR